MRTRPAVGFLAIILATAYALLGSAVLAQDAPSVPTLDRQDLETWLDGFVPYALQRGDVAGAVVLVLKDGQVLFEKGYGYADVGAKRRMDPHETILGMGSVSKTLAWTAVMQQVEQGKLDLDRDVNDYLDIRIPPAFGKPITLRQLMTHTAGFEERVFRVAPAGTVARPLREYIQQVPPPDRIYTPGEIPAYSNYGSMLAGYIVERVSGERFVPYIQHHILQPLGMLHSTFERPTPAAFRDQMAKSYAVASGQPNPPQNEEPAGDPSGHFITTADDMSHFMLAHLQEGRYDSTQLLRPQTARLMHAPACVGIPGGRATALGFFRMDYNGHPIIAHMGDIASFHADVELLLDDQVGFFLAVNSTGISKGALGAAYALRQAAFRQFMDRYFPTRQATDETHLPTLPTARQHAQLAAGEYQMSRRHAGDFMEALELFARFSQIPLDITANEDGKIVTPAWLSFETGQPQTWRETAPFEWQEVGGTARLNMKVEAGRVAAFYPSDILPGWLNERVPTIWSPKVNIPLLLAACSVVLLATVLWPITMITRRYYGRAAPTEWKTPSARSARYAAVLGTAYIVAWLAVVFYGVFETLRPDVWLRLTQALGLACVGGAAAAIWNARLKCTEAHSMWVRAGSLALALALLEIVYFSFAFHLISLHLNY
jgi:CubicO group peptidase (beta-lactamase class C family)